MDLDNSKLIEAKLEYIFKAIEDAGITITDFTRITDISRTTIYRWKEGKNVSDKIRLNIAYDTAINLQKAYNLNMLPLNTDLKKLERLPALRRILEKVSPKY